MTKLMKSMILEMPFLAPCEKPSKKRELILRACILTVLDLGLYNPAESIDELDYTDLRRLIGVSSTEWKIIDSENILENEKKVLRKYGQVIYEKIKDDTLVLLESIVNKDEQRHELNMFLDQKKLLSTLD